MNRKLASIQRIKNLEIIANSDTLERATVLGWEVVVKRGTFKVRDLVVYVEIDSFLPTDNLDFEFLRKSCYRKFTTGEEGFRIKTVRLRGQISQGICFPLTILSLFDDWDFPGILIEGRDITDILRIKKYEPPIPAHLAGEVKGQFPAFISKTDEIRIQATVNVLERHQGTFMYATEKLDGTSVTFYINNGEFGVCSRNLELKETEGNSLWNIARKLNLEEKMKAFEDNIALQGELIGSGIQDNPYKLKDHQIYFFNIFNIDKYAYMSLEEVRALLEHWKLEMVPILGRFLLENSVPKLVEFSQGQSTLCSESKREGIVVRPLVEERDPELGRFSFKVINPEYLLELD